MYRASCDPICYFFETARSSIRPSFCFSWSKGNICVSNEALLHPWSWFGRKNLWTTVEKESGREKWDAHPLNYRHCRPAIAADGISQLRTEVALSLWQSFFLVAPKLHVPACTSIPIISPKANRYFSVLSPQFGLNFFSLLLPDLFMSRSVLFSRGSVLKRFGTFILCSKLHYATQSQ